MFEPCSQTNCQSAVHIWCSCVKEEVYNLDFTVRAVNGSKELIGHQNEGGIGKSIPNTREISRGKSRRRRWISQYLLSFGGERTFSHLQSFYKEWISKGLTMLKLILPSGWRENGLLIYMSVNCHDNILVDVNYNVPQLCMEDLKINQCWKRVESIFVSTAASSSLPIIFPSWWGKRFLPFHFHWLPFLPADHNQTAHFDILCCLYLCICICVFPCLW